jgi:hypothetical protein
MASQGPVLQDGHSVNQRVPEAQGGFGFVPGDVANGFLEIGNGLGRKDYFATHERTRLRTSSIGAPLPASTSLMASSRECSSRC